MWQRKEVGITTHGGHGRNEALGGEERTIRCYSRETIKESEFRDRVRGFPKFCGTKGDEKPRVGGWDDNRGFTPIWRKTQLG